MTMRPLPLLFGAALMLVGCHRAPEAAPPASAASSSPPPATHSVAPPPQVVASAPLISSQHAFYQGSLPCDGCRSEHAQLTLQHDALGANKYVLRQTIERDGSSSPRVETGHWTLKLDRAGSPPIAVLTLDSGRPGQAHVFTVALDGSLEPLAGNAGERLARTRGDLDFSALYATPAAAASAQH